jgi:hypothetical protein
MKYFFTFLSILTFSDLKSSQIADSTKNVTRTHNSYLLYWLILAVITIIIFYFLIKKYRKPRHIISVPDDWRRGAGSHDFSDVFDGVSGKASNLYAKLIRKCHPDRFIGNQEKYNIATELSSKITNNKNSYSKLLELKREAEDMLGISFD